MSFFLLPFQIFAKYKKILYATTLVDIKNKYAGSAFGMIWLWLYPVLFLSAYCFVYVFIFKVQVEGMSSLEYVLMIFAGLVPFLGFSEGLSVSTVSVTSNASIVKNTVYPSEILPIKAVLCSQCTQAVGMLLLLLALFFTGRLSWYALFIIPVWFFQLLFGFGIGWLFASINVLSKDLQNVVSVITLFLMMASPIAYRASTVEGFMRVVLSVNPLYYFITCYQSCLIYSQPPPLGVFAFLAVFSVLVFLLGYAFFTRMRQLFADNL